MAAPDSSTGNHGRGTKHPRLLGHTEKQCGYPLPDRWGGQGTQRVFTDKQQQLGVPG